jgi:predicted nuclease with TOPRIM domain
MIPVYLWPPSVSQEMFFCLHQHNRLRDYKRRLSAVQAENETLKRENEANKKRSKEWVDALQDKLREFRKEKTSWTNEAVALRGQVKDAQVCIDLACDLERLAR